MDPKPDHSASPLPGLSAFNDLPSRGADAVDAVVDFIQLKAVRPLTQAARGIVFGIIVFTGAVVILTLLSITLIRLLTVYIPGNRVWVSDLVIGVLFVVAGILAWTRRIDRSMPAITAAAGPNTSVS
jgi:NADH:ubiquinone oxidoreductase subunit 6 (subunit J)